MVAAFPVLGLVVNGRAHHFHLAGGEIALEIQRVVIGVPQAPFQEGEKLERLGLPGGVFQGEPVHLAIEFQRHGGGQCGAHAVAGARDGGVSQAMPALVGVERRAGGLPAGVPHIAAIIDVEIAPAVVHGNVVVAVPGDPAQACVPIERIAAGGVGDDPEIRIIAKIIDPGIRGFRGGDDVLASGVIEMSELHELALLRLVCLSRTRVYFSVTYSVAHMLPLHAEPLCRPPVKGLHACDGSRVMTWCARGAPQVARRTSVTGSVADSTAGFPPSKSFTSPSTARLAMSKKGTRTVVSAG